MNQYYNIDLSNSYIITHPSTTAIAAGQSGYNVISRRYRSVSMLNNTITNTRIGISLKSGTGGGTISQFAGNVDINYNTIQANPTGGSPGLGMAVTTGISVQNMFLTGSGAGSSAIGNVNTNNNTMNYVYNGINVNGYHFGQPLYSNNNTISVFNWAANVNPQYGISHVNCITNTINGNTVTSQGYNLPLATSDTNKAGKLTGIFGSNNYNAVVTCNFTGYINVGFQFLGSGNITNWLNNEMEQNTFGLAAKGSFGDQGNNTMPCNDVWRNILPWWTGGNRNIMTLNGYAPVDTLYVSPNPSSLPTYYYDPLNNYNNPIPVTFRYGFGGTGTGNGLNVITVPAFLPVCLAPYSMYLKAIPKVTGPFVESMGQNWIAQNSIWQSIQLDNSLKDSSAILNQFATMAASSRYKWLGDIEAAIMSGDESTANTLLAMDIHANMNTLTDATTGVTMQDGVDADYIVSNYITLYNEYLKFMDSTMTGDDSLQVLAIASLCPYSYGNVVYNAQAFYRILYDDDTTYFDDNCSSGVSPRQAQPSVTNALGEQGYQLFPNPNDGSFMLRQAIRDGTPANVEVTDMLGRVIITKDVRFINNTTQLQLNNLSSGVYLLKVTDSNKKVSNFKFVVQK